MKCFALLAGVAFLAAAPAMADSLVLPETVLPRTGPVPLTYRLDAKLSGTGRLSLEWTDGAGRLVERRTMPVALDKQDEIALSIDLRRAMVARNTLHVRVALPGHDGAAQADFIAAPMPDGWSEFRFIMWQGHNAAGYATLKRLGVTAATITGMSGAMPIADVLARLSGVLDADLRWYPENLATDFYSPYHRYSATHSDVTWLWLEMLARFKADPTDAGVFQRQPSLSDPAWLERVGERLRATANSLRALRPLFYNLGDEPGIADLAAFWDFDFSPVSLAAFRVHLRRVYANVAMLNRQWGTDFADWDSVMPQTTPAAIARGDENFSAWSEFRDWMDIAFADAFQAGARALHAADPAALAGLEGGQVAGTGGWSYAKLAPVLDVMEIYEAGSNVAMARSANPRLKILATSFEGGRAGLWRIWHSVLSGGAGMVIWDDQAGYVAQDSSLAPRGREAEPVIREIGAGLGAQLVASRVAQDRVAMLYSESSHRMRWMLDRRAGAKAGNAKPWSDRGSEAEGIEDDALRRSIRGVTDQLSHLGVQPRFISPEQLASGVLRGAEAPLVLVLPQALALSDRELAEIRVFAAGGGTVLADADPGQFDGHGARRATLPIAHSLLAPFPPDLAAMAETLDRAGAAPALRLLDAAGAPVRDVTIHRFRNGGVTLVGLQADAGAPQIARHLTLAVPTPAWLHDLRGGSTGPVSLRHDVTLPADGPIVLALADAALPPPVVAGPRQLATGSTAVWRVTLGADSPAAAHVLHVEVTRPDGTVSAIYSGNVVLRGRATVWPVPFAADDPVGMWQLRFTDRLGGGVAQAVVELK
jgi:hypothetical protein